MPGSSVFISYAREDDGHRAELRKHLRPFEDDRRLTVWDDRAIEDGAEWQEEILLALEQATVVVFLLSADLLASDFVRDCELPEALKRRARGEAAVIPVVVRACPWRETELGRLQALREGKPVTEGNPDRAWTEIAQRIAEAAKRSEPPPPEPAYPDERTRDLSMALAEAYRREGEAAAQGADSRSIQREILDLKRQMREDGLSPGDLLSGRFQLIEAIGEGGFARVWKAWDQKLRHLVAVKALHQQYASGTRRQRFFRGARQMAKLDHPHIVRILGEPERLDGACRFFVMELADGGDLQRAVRAGELNISDRLRIVLEVGEALDHAHGRGIVHRDVKPANVLLDSGGKAKLSDFDLVRAQDSTGGTRTGMLGTVVYAAPESMERAKEAGVRADVFGLGMTAIFALHGRDLPARDLLRDAPGFARRLVAPKPVSDVLARAVAWEPQERQEDVARLCAQLSEALKEPTARRQTAETVPAPAPQTSSAEARPAPPQGSSPPEELFRWIETPVDGRVELWREIPAGEGWVGSPKSESQWDDERPRHRVKILQPFQMAAVPVMNAHYAAFDAKHAGDKPPDLPVVGVSWRQAVQFCRWLEETFAWARGARLPREEEWEFACRAGTETAYWSGKSEEDLARVGWYGRNSGNRTHRVGEKPANPWGLYDVHGNVWEWTASVWRDDYSSQAEGIEIDPAEPPADLAAAASARRVVRGGSCWLNAGRTRAAYRYHGDPVIELVGIGFRVLLPPLSSGPERH